jgi:hypothetical protein
MNGVCPLDHECYTLSRVSCRLFKIKPVAAYGEIDTDVAARAQANPGMAVFLNDGDAVLTNLQVGKRSLLGWCGGQVAT